MTIGLRSLVPTLIPISLVPLITIGACSTDADSSSDLRETSQAGTVADGSVGRDGGRTDAATDAIAPGSPPTVILPKTGLDASELGVVVNVNDPQSVALAAYYVQARNIPPENVVELAFATNVHTLTPEAFAPLYTQLNAAMPATVQALALTWTRPFRVGGTSITSAFAHGYDASYDVGCDAGRALPTYNSDTRAPFTDFGIRPTMMIAAGSVADGKTFIDRGVSADGTMPSAKAWLVRTTDSTRSVRASSYPAVVAQWAGSTFVDATFVDATAPGMPPGSSWIQNETDIGFYFTGHWDVQGIDTNTYLPGAIADHMTSFGGWVPDGLGNQMSALRWLEAGATGSYGSVSEPCAYVNKFSSAPIVMRRYVRGEPLIEAYWKSVLSPGQGLFIGEPLARPWKDTWSYDGGVLTIRAVSLLPGRTYEVRAKQDAAPEAPYTVATTITVSHAPPVVQDTPIIVENATAPFYELALLPPATPCEQPPCERPDGGGGFAEGE